MGLPFYLSRFRANTQVRPYGICDHKSPVDVIEHDGYGLVEWDQVTRVEQMIESGVYIYHLTSHSPGSEGQTKIGTFAVIK